VNRAAPIFEATRERPCSWTVATPVPSREDAAVSASRGYLVRPIGHVESSLADRRAAPKQGDQGAPDAWLVFEKALRPGLSDLKAGMRVLVLTWLHQASRDVLRVHPQDNPANPETGVFATRSADRPNPIGIHPVEILEVRGTRLHVSNLEAVHGTPILDVKPVL
jgi:tRNA-Thr(GGU) m(6)t(6)A37 methyltransferase TsaA